MPRAIPRISDPTSRVLPVPVSRELSPPPRVERGLGCGAPRGAYQGVRARQPRWEICRASRNPMVTERRRPIHLLSEIRFLNCRILSRFLYTSFFEVMKPRFNDRRHVKGKHEPIRDAAVAVLWPGHPLRDVPMQYPARLFQILGLWHSRRRTLG